MDINQAIENLSEAVLKDIKNDEDAQNFVNSFPNIREAIFKILAGVF